eukprot:7259992-Pyramimonas_sp.AAC.1
MRSVAPAAPDTSRHARASQKASSTPMDAIIQDFLHAAALASSLRPARLAAPEKAPASTVSTSMNPRSTWRSLMVRPISPLPFFADSHAPPYLDVMMPIAPPTPCI